MTKENSALNKPEERWETRDIAPRGVSPAAMHRVSISTIAGNSPSSRVRFFVIFFVKALSAYMYPEIATKKAIGILKYTGLPLRARKTKALKPEPMAIAN